MSVASFTSLAWAHPLIIASLLLLVYFLSTAIYRLYFHPLSRFPGPTLWALSYIPYSLAIRRGDLVYYTEKFHSKYGEIVRLKPDEVSFINPQAWQDIYGIKLGGKRNFRKDPMRYLPAVNGTYSIIGCPTETTHARYRRLLSHAFSDRALRAQEPLLQFYVSLLMQKLQKLSDANEPIIILDWLNYTTFDIISDLAFGSSFNCLQTGTYHPWVRMLFSHFKALALISSVMYFPWLFKALMYTLPKAVKQRRIDHFNFAREKVHERMEAGSETGRPDFMSYVLRYGEGISTSDGKDSSGREREREREPEKGMTLPEIEATLAIIIVAGAETTATSLTGIISYLIKPQYASTVLKKLVEEVRGMFEREEDITAEEVGKLTYLNAVIEEGLRLCPPVPTGLPRVVPEGGDYVCGEWLPENTAVSYASWAATHSPTHFHDPEIFAPERWLASSSTSSSHSSPSLSPSPYANDTLPASQPFSVGPRNCIGKNLAYLEMRLILARLLWGFELEGVESGMGVGKGEGGAEWRDQKVYTLWEKRPFGVRLRRRRG